MTTAELLTRAKAAKTALAALSTADKNRALLAMAKALTDRTAEILSENKQDVEAARAHISEVMLDRLALTEARIAAMAEGIREVAVLPDPVGRLLAENTLANGLSVKKVAVPMGVIAIIYESRPNVTSDAAALCLKSGNVCVLRCGKEAHRSSLAIVKALKEGLSQAGISEDCIQILEDISREGAHTLMTAGGYIDLLIPRGGAGLIRACVETATVPCIETGTGICHIYVDESADLNKALNVVENAKTQRPSVCNAEEVLLVHRDIAPTFLPMLKERLVTERQKNGQRPVELRLDAEALTVIDGIPATEKDFDTEFLDYILACRVVGSVEEAIAHIEAHSTHHSDAILTENKEAARLFTLSVDSAAVYVNASTRFTDGGQFGLGCEMGISTQKLHARGPMGLEELTAYKYLVTGNGQIRS